MLAIWVWQVAKVSDPEWAELMMKARSFSVDAFLLLVFQRLAEWPLFPAVVMIREIHLSSRWSPVTSNSAPGHPAANPEPFS